MTQTTYSRKGSDKGSKFTAPIAEALAKNEPSVNLGPCSFNQVLLFKVSADEVMATFIEGAGGAVSARIKALSRCVPEGTYTAEQKDGMLKWHKEDN